MRKKLIFLCVILLPATALPNEPIGFFGIENTLWDFVSVYHVTHRIGFANNEIYLVRISDNEVTVVPNSLIKNFFLFHQFEGGTMDESLRGIAMPAIAMGFVELCEYEKCYYFFIFKLGVYWEP